MGPGRTAELSIDGVSGHWGREANVRVRHPWERARQSVASLVLITSVLAVACAPAASAPTAAPAKPAEAVKPSEAAKPAAPAAPARRWRHQ